VSVREPDEPHPPAGALRHRLWRVWYDTGVMFNGACVIETAWYARSSHPEIIRADEYNDLIAAIDLIEDALNRTGGFRLAHTPPPNGPRYSFWKPDLRGKTPQPETTK